MKLRSLSVNQFRKFTAPTRLENLGDGLNLVIGPNEMGKSTLLAALRAVLFERHGSRAGVIRSFRNDRSGNAPVVEARFEIDGGEYTIAKRFLSSPYARLECPDGVTLEGGGAEAELRELLGFSESGARGADDESVGMWGLLWVQQGRSFGAPELSDSARSNLGSALESEVGEVLGGRRGREMPQIIEQQLGEWLSAARRQPRGEYREALDERSALEEQLAELQLRRGELSETLTALEQAEQRAERLASGEQDAWDHEQLQGARAALQREIELASRIAEAETTLELRRRTHDEALRTAAERTAQRDHLATEEEALTRDRSALAEIEAADRDVIAQLEQLGERRRETADADARAQAADARCRDIISAIGDAQQIERLAAARDTALEAEHQLSEARRQVEALAVTAELVERIRRQERRLQRTEAQIGAVATRISFDIPPDRADDITVDGALLAQLHGAVDAVEPLTIAIPERGRIVVQPNIENSGDLLRERAEATAALQAALGEAGAASLADAEAELRRRERLEGAMQLAQERLAGHAPQGVAALVDQLAGRRQRLDGLTAALELDALPPSADAEADAQRAREELADARQAAQLARDAYDERDRSLAEHRQQLSDLRAAVRQADEQITRLRKELDLAVEEASDDQLAATIAGAARRVAEQEQVIVELRRGRPENARELAEARIERLERVIEQRRQDRSAVQAEISGLQQRLEVQEAAGIDEELALAERRREQTEARVARMERRIAVHELALGALQEAERQARERYLAPVRDRVRPYLQMLFPDAALDMDEDLQVTGISRTANHSESFELLSMGTQEQLAVLIRLAFAELLAEQGQPAAVILDDALVFSDDQRMQTMFDILNVAARRVQIIIFTCRGQLFEGLGAKRLELSVGDAEQLRSA